MSEQIADGTVETPSVEDLQARLAKAEAKIVELKKAPTKEEASTEEATEEVVSEKEENVDINSIVEKAVSAALIANNNITSNNMSMSGNPAPADTFSLKTVAEYNKLSPAEQSKHMKECIAKTGSFEFRQDD